jgi:hypothetical protein
LKIEIQSQKEKTTSKKSTSIIPKEYIATFAAITGNLIKAFAPLLISQKPAAQQPTTAQIVSPSPSATIAFTRTPEPISTATVPSSPTPETSRLTDGTMLIPAGEFLIGTNASESGIEEDENPNILFHSMPIGLTRLK